MPRHIYPRLLGGASLPSAGQLNAQSIVEKTTNIRSSATRPEHAARFGDSMLKTSSISLAQLGKSMKIIGHSQIQFYTFSRQGRPSVCRGSTHWPCQALRPKDEDVPGSALIHEEETWFLALDPTGFQQTPTTPWT